MNMKAYQFTAPGFTLRTFALGAALVWLSLVPAPLSAQSELERLGGGPGGVPQGNPHNGGFFNERQGMHPRASASPAGAPSVTAVTPGEESEGESGEQPITVQWKNGLLTVDADNVPTAALFLEFTNVTKISVKINPGSIPRVTAHVKNLRIERALAMFLPERTWRIVRKPNTALRADDAILGIVITPALPPGSTENPVAAAMNGATNIGPTFEGPGAETTGSLPVETSHEPDMPPNAQTPSLATTTQTVSVTMPRMDPSITTDLDVARRRIADLVEQNKKKMKR